MVAACYLSPGAGAPITRTGVPGGRARLSAKRAGVVPNLSSV
jgi:hypothetical protein